jgi:hypothetical protein
MPEKLDDSFYGFALLNGLILLVTSALILSYGVPICFFSSIGCDYIIRDNSSQSLIPNFLFIILKPFIFLFLKFFTFGYGIGIIIFIIFKDITFTRFFLTIILPKKVDLLTQKQIFIFTAFSYIYYFVFT